MEPTTERRLREADPLARGTSEEERDQDWLRRAADAAMTMDPGSRRPRGLVMVAAAAAVVLAAAAGGFALRGMEHDDSAGAAPAAPTVTGLTLGVEDTTAMCVRFSVETLSPMPVAFGGVVAEKSSEEVLLDVDTWYRGGDTDQVRLQAPDMSMTSLGSSIDFQVGSRYLVTANEGNVNYCGFSGPWTQDLADAYAAAFGAAH
jgi:hypothetical protein